MYAKVLQMIFDKIQDYSPANWTKIIFYAGYSIGSYSMNFYVDCGTGEYVDCFANNSTSQLIPLFIEIDKELSRIRKNLSEKERWNVFTMIVDSEGNMTTEFDYSNIDKNSIEYERKWKERYLQ